MKRIISASLLLVAGCAGGAETTSTAEAPAASEGTAGGEAPAQAEAALPTTVPVPVPLPAVPRAEMSDTLQQVWTLVEQAVEVRPPDPPEEASAEAIEAWAQGPFSAWVAERQEANLRAQALVATLGEDAAEERLVAAALFGYMYEDMASGIRGAPIPEGIASDPELLGIYVDTLHQLLDPVARLAAHAYLICRQLALGFDEDSGWRPWATYCDGRGLEVVQTFDLLAHDERAAAAGASDADAPPTEAGTEAASTDEAHAPERGAEAASGQDSSAPQLSGAPPDR